MTNTRLKNLFNVEALCSVMYDAIYFPYTLLSCNIWCK